MYTSTFDILRCPYCGSRLDLVLSSFHETSGDEIHTGILGCQCCVFPVVDGIPIMHLQPAATAAREFVEQGRPDRARRAMFGLEDEGQAERFEALAVSGEATYRDIVEALGAFYPRLNPVGGPQRPGHARGIVCNPETSPGIQQNDSAVPVDTVFQIIHGFGCDPLRHATGGDPVRRPLGQHQFHDGLAPSGGRDGCTLVIRVAAAAD